MFSVILEQNPDYEHGRGFYNLASCYEDLGEYEKAEQHYRRALEYNFEDPILLGGYASFLYLHGDPELAFKAYLNLLRLDRSGGSEKDAELAILALRELGKRVGLTDRDVTEKIEEISP
ncbi:MAG: tetratricopeptide repeat protein [Pyrinomonadaceae bacterium]